MSPTPVTLPGCVVRYLRRGIRLRLATVAKTLGLALANEPGDSILLKRELDRFDEARTLLDIIGSTNAFYEREVEIDISPWSYLILSALQSQHQQEIGRLQDAAADGIQLPQRDVPLLGDVVAQLRNAIGVPPHRLMLRPMQLSRRGCALEGYGRRQRP